MAGTTPNGLPYPTGTDLVRDGDNAIKALADAVDTRLGWAYVRYILAYPTSDVNGDLTVVIDPPLPKAVEGFMFSYQQGGAPYFASMNASNTAALYLKLWTGGGAQAPNVGPFRCAVIVWSQA
jgi:hypothetical protein